MINKFGHRIRYKNKVGTYLRRVGRRLSLDERRLYFQMYYCDADEYGEYAYVWFDGNKNKSKVKYDAIIFESDGKI